MKLLLHVSSHFEYEELSKKSNEKHLSWVRVEILCNRPLAFRRYWACSFPLTHKTALLLLPHFITMYLVWRIRNSMPSWHPGERKLHCLSWCARSSPLRTERSGWVCESAACRPSLTEERVLSGWKKEKTNENSKRNNAKRQKKWLSLGLPFRLS